jgi:Kef-type K+ transport system membrane component KefB
VTDPREWQIAAVVSVVIGVIMAILGAPAWSYPIALGGFIAGLFFYQRSARARND